MNRHGKLAEGQTRLSVQVSTDEKQALQHAAKQDRRSLINFLSLEVAAIVARIRAKQPQPAPDLALLRDMQGRADAQLATRKK